MAAGTSLRAGLVGVHKRTDTAQQPDLESTTGNEGPRAGTTNGRVVRRDPMRMDDDDILALGAAWLAGYVVSCWHSGMVLGDIILHADGSIETKAPDVWQLLDAPVVVDRPSAAPAADPLLAQPLRPDDDIHRLLAAVVNAVGASMPNLVDYLTTLENRALQEVRGYLTWEFCAHRFAAPTTPQEALVHYIEHTQRFLLRPAIEHLLEAVVATTAGRSPPGVVVYHDHHACSRARALHPSLCVRGSPRARERHRWFSRNFYSLNFSNL